MYYLDADGRDTDYVYCFDGNDSGSDLVYVRGASDYLLFFSLPLDGQMLPNLLLAFTAVVIGRLNHTDVWEFNKSLISDKQY